MRQLTEVALCGAHRPLTQGPLLGAAALLACLLAVFLGDNFVSSTDIVSFTLFGFLSSTLIDGTIWQIVILYVIFQFFIAGPISVGRARFFLNSIDGDVKITDIFFAFRTRNYWNIALGQLAVNLLVVAGFLVPALLGIFITGNSGDVIPTIVRLALLIPGLTLLYRFRLVPYVLARNPHFWPNNALGLSNDLATGRRWEIFMLDMSFVGWYILAPLAFGIGIFFVLPYHEATMAHYYHEVKQLPAIEPKMPAKIFDEHIPEYLDMSK